MRNKNGSLQRPGCALEGVRPNIAIPGRPTAGPAERLGTAAVDRYRRPGSSACAAPSRKRMAIEIDLSRSSAASATFACLTRCPAPSSPPRSLCSKRRRGEPELRENDRALRGIFGEDGASGSNPAWTANESQVWGFLRGWPRTCLSNWIGQKSHSKTATRPWIRHE